jgi:hypothetical protein
MYLLYDRCVPECPKGISAYGTGVFNRRCGTSMSASLNDSSIQLQATSSLEFIYPNGEPIINSGVNEILLQFRAAPPGGLILSASRNTSFISLELCKSNIYFQLNLGSGAVLLSTESSGLVLDDGMWHTVVISRVSNYAVLTVDSFSQDGFAPGRATLLLVNSLFLGDTKSNISITRTGYTGCIRNAVVDRFPLTMIAASYMSGPSPLPCTKGGCDTSPCIHGRCMSLDAKNYTCSCFLQYEGAQCNSTISVVDCQTGQRCWNGAVCRSTGGCDCPLGYSGASCEEGVFSYFKKQYIISLTWWRSLNIVAWRYIIIVPYCTLKSF